MKMSRKANFKLRTGLKKMMDHNDKFLEVVKLQSKPAKKAAFYAPNADAVEKEAATHPEVYLLPKSLYIHDFTKFYMFDQFHTFVHFTQI
jgi:hypothetical protein